MQTIEDACRRLLHSNVDMVGFDMEWWTQFKTGVAPREVALIQLCYEEPQLESGPTDASRQQPGHATPLQRCKNKENQERTSSPCLEPPSKRSCIAPAAAQLASPQHQRYHCLLLHISCTGPAILPGGSYVESRMRRLHKSRHTPGNREPQPEADWLAQTHARPPMSALCPCHASERAYGSDYYACCAGMTPALREVLECEAIAKAGVGINGDAEKLSLDHRVRLRGTLDIGAELNARVQPRGCELVERTAFTLADAAARLLRARLPKLQRLRCSNWEAAPLTAGQRWYAALDALASLRCARAALRLPLRKRAQLLDTAPAWQASQVSQ